MQGNPIGTAFGFLAEWIAKRQFLLLLSSMIPVDQNGFDTSTSSVTELVGVSKPLTEGEEDKDTPHLLPLSNLKKHRSPSDGW